jgi:dephospho-CoA kinase
LQEQRVHIYGLSGGTGSGKSEAARRFAEHGIPIVDADEVGHEMIAPGGPAEQAVLEAFGDGILENGAISRSKLGTIVFGNADQLRRLSQIVHPLLKQTLWRRCADLARAGNEVVVVDAAIIGDDGRLDEALNGLVLVLAREEERLRRLLAKGLPREAAQQRIAAQVPPENKVTLARWVVDNNGTLQELRDQVDTIAREMLAREGRSTS